MDQKVVDAFSRGVSASMRAAKFQVFYAVLLAVVAGIFFLNDKPLVGLLQCFCSCLSLLSALMSYSAAKKWRPFIDGTAER